MGSDGFESKKLGGPSIGTGPGRLVTGRPGASEYAGGAVMGSIVIEVNP